MRALFADIKMELCTPKQLQPLDGAFVTLYVQEYQSFLNGAMARYDFSFECLLFLFSFSLINLL